MWLTSVTKWGIWDLALWSGIKSVPSALESKDFKNGEGELWSFKITFTSISILTTGKYTLDSRNITNLMVENTKFGWKTMIESYFLKTHLVFVEGS